MRTYSTTLMVHHRNSCEKDGAELLLLGAKPVDLSEYPKLKHVFRAGIGSENIPIEEAKGRGIMVHFPSTSTRSTISMAVARLAFGWIVNEGAMDRDIAAWYREPRKSKKRVCVIGWGHVGKLVEGMVLDVEMECDISDVKHGLKNYHPYDILSFHIPVECYEHGSAYRDNKHLISRDFLQYLKPSVTMINTSRGGIADEADIAEFLSANPKSKYITDVYEEEPYAENSPLHPFLGTQFWGTPHIASYTDEVREALTKDVLELIRGLE